MRVLSFQLDSRKILDESFNKSNSSNKGKSHFLKTQKMTRKSRPNLLKNIGN